MFEVTLTLIEIPTIGVLRVCVCVPTACEAVRDCRKFYKHLPGGTEENHENHSDDSWSRGRDLNLGPPEYKAGVLTPRLRLQVRTAQNPFLQNTALQIVKTDGTHNSSELQQ
jgi:hypothetical protein